MNKVGRPANTLLDSMADKVLIGDGCWEWTGAKVRGYGYVKFGGKSHRAHKAVYEMMVGPVPEGMHLHHECENKGCVRPDHLAPMAAGEHTRLTNAQTTHCPKGHEYTPENTYLWNNARDCRACSRERNREYRKGRNV